MNANLAAQAIDNSGWRFSVVMQLGRVSNLPTVWTNTLAAIVLSGQSVSLTQVVALLFAMSLAYTGGMFLNDAFDRDIDARERAERPIPSGRVSATQVFIVSFCMLIMCVITVTAIGFQTSNTLQALISSSALCLTIIVYNLWHKGNPISPLLMGLCRLMVYICCAMSLTAEPSQWVFIGALITFAYLIGLTYTAKQEKLGHVSTLWPLAFLTTPIFFGAYYLSVSVWVVIAVLMLSGWILYCLRLILRRQSGDIPRAVVQLIAGISLIDGLLIGFYLTHVATTPVNVLSLMLSCYLAFGLTLLFQRYVSGT